LITIIIINNIIQLYRDFVKDFYSILKNFIDKSLSRQIQ